jgi:hypothetical protein
VTRRFRGCECRGDFSPTILQNGERRAPGRVPAFVFRQKNDAAKNLECGASRALGPQNRESILAAKLLMVLSASIIFTLGVVHLVYTFWGPKLTPRDPALQISMSQIAVPRQNPVQAGRSGQCLLSDKPIERVRTLRGKIQVLGKP